MTANINDEQINCGIYRSNDPIINFKIRVKLERYTSNSLLPGLERLKIQDDLSRLLDYDGKPTNKFKPTKAEMAGLSAQAQSTDYEEVVIGWQEKLFSRAEFEIYGKAVGSHSTPDEQKYFDQIRNMKANRKRPGRIFTYIENDSYCSHRNLELFMTDSPNERPSELALGINTFHKRGTLQSNFRQHNKVISSKTNVVNNSPTLDEIRMNHFASWSYQTMYIMADLSNRIDTTAGVSALVLENPNVHVLCQINVYSNGTIVLKPDFNTDKLSYMIETKAFHNDVYHYFIEHASTKVDIGYLKREKRLLAEICARQQMNLTKILGQQFDMPPPNFLKLNIFGEIVSGKNFDYDDIYVYYCLDLTDNWYVESSMLLSGYTHTSSSTASSKYDDIVYYSHPFEFELWYRPPFDLADQQVPRMPKIYFQIASLDTWNRHRTEGYTYIDVPSFPGFYDEHLSCWRPYGNSIFDELRRFYIGGSAELEEISYVAIPKSYQNQPNDKILSRFGFRTVSTGTLHIRLNVVFQSESLAREYRKNPRNSTTQRYGFNIFMDDTNDVINEYEKAKKRALEVQERKFREFKLDTYDN